MRITFQSNDKEDGKEERKNILSERFNQRFVRQVRDIFRDIIYLPFWGMCDFRDARRDAFKNAQLAEHFEGVSHFCSRLSTQRI